MAMVNRSALVVMLCVLILVVNAQGQVVLAPAPGPSPANATGNVTQYYISYGALSANRAPCPSGAGQSYYATNCTVQTGIVTPYTRSCNQITRCARG